MVTSTAEEEKRKKPAQSNFCSRTALRSGISFQVAHRPAMPTGMLIRKIQCQEAYWTMMPPSTGPREAPARRNRHDVQNVDEHGARIGAQDDQTPYGHQEGPPDSLG